MKGTARRGRDARGGRRAGRPPSRVGEGPGRERDDRGHAAQRPRPRRRARDRRGRPRCSTVERYPTVLQMTSTVTARSRPRLRRSWPPSSPAPRSPGRRRCARWRSSPSSRRPPAASTRERSAGRPRRDRVVQRRHPHRSWPTAGEGGHLRRGQRCRGRLDGRRRVRGVPAQGPHPRDPALRAARDDALGAGRGLLPARAPPRAARPVREGLPFPVDMRRVEEALREAAAAGVPLRARLLLHSDGRVEIQGGTRPAAPTRPCASGSRRARWTPQRFYTTRPTAARSTRRRRSRPDSDDVLLWNARGEVTESTSPT